MVRPQIINETYESHCADAVLFSSGRIELQKMKFHFARTCLLYVVKHYIAEKDCDQISGNIHPSCLDEYAHEEEVNGGKKLSYFGVNRMGIPFNSTYGKDSDSMEKINYYESVPQVLNRLRSFCPNNQTPIDRMKEELSALLQRNVSPASFEGRGMFFGILRYMSPDLSYLSELEPHFDFLPIDIARLKNQFAANIYIETPENGGELEIYDYKIENDNYVAPSNWRNHLEKQGLLPVIYKPEKGDLIFMCTRMPHAIYRFSSGRRISFQTFIGQTIDNEYVLWN